MKVVHWGKYVTGAMGSWHPVLPDGIFVTDCSGRQLGLLTALASALSGYDDRMEVPRHGGEILVEVRSGWIALGFPRRG